MAAKMTLEPTVFVVDDDASVRKSTCLLLESERLAFEAHESATAFLEHFNAQRPGCIILDMAMPGMSGIELVEKLRGSHIEIPILVVSGTGTIPAAVQVMKLGIIDFLEKPVEPQLLMNKVREALRLDARRRQEAAARDEACARMAHLTAREWEVVNLLAVGLSNKEIAANLVISVKTVENHRASIMTKTSALNVADLVRIKHLCGV